MLNNRKICFIICVNDEKIYKEALLYIKNLNVPEGYQVDTLCIKNVGNIGKAYNQAIQDSNAKYKIYMHEDVFIINKHFIKDFVNIFEKNEKIGMLGVVGSKKIPVNGIWEESTDKYGKVYNSHTEKMKLLEFHEVSNEYENVKTLDGLLMITQYDIPWREDIFDDCYFYDLSQCVEFTKSEYDVAVAKQTQPWCMHDSEIFTINDHYEYYRKLFLDQYLTEYSPKYNIKQNTELKFVTLFPECDNVHLIKDVGMIPYIMHKYFGYNSSVATYENSKFPFLDKEVKGLKLDYITRYTSNSNLDGYVYLVQNAKNIDVLQLFHLIPRTLNWINIYKHINPKGKVYLKLDENVRIKNNNFNDIFNETNVNILKQCDLISVETKDLYAYINKKWPIKVAYIPNGFFAHDYKNKMHINYEEKENVICTVGRIGNYFKATEILMEAFKIVSIHIPNWKLKIVGPIEKDFKPYIEKFFRENPQLIDQIIFTGTIVDREKVKKEYENAKIFCLTSRLESFAIVLVEAISSGCYIITSNIPSANDITNNKKFGDLFKIDNIKELSQCIMNACRNEEKLKSVCCEVQDYAYDKFNWVKICAKIDKLL
ncbi:glycosyltransferase [Marinisporobacter balticus]|uniref:Glycosyltransferase involved in cell wall biosynthesis n=1 Tax=Marinisporobacter balticus TaxID=2018667 RepID=A0A4R2KRP1_9FIRM|nr:glycosyltransferase [Marinisporobacter balticus]TCO73639.1 glycosyltransferase involved in cell wall biosynthesis [Marinisporobacter balticus]